MMARWTLHGKFWTRWYKPNHWKIHCMILVETKLKMPEQVVTAHKHLKTVSLTTSIRNLGMFKVTSSGLFRLPYTLESHKEQKKKRLLLVESATKGARAQASAGRVTESIWKCKWHNYHRSLCVFHIDICYLWKDIHKVIQILSKFLIGNISLEYVSTCYGRSSIRPW